MTEDTEHQYSFVERWLSEHREGDEFELQILDLIEEHRDGSKLKETALLNALIEHADTQMSKNDGATS